MFLGFNVSSTTRKRNTPPCGDSATKRQMVDEPQKGNALDMEKLKKLVALTASVKIDAGESAKCLRETKVSIGLAGDTSTGKSSMLNALLKTAAMPMADVSCTAYPVKVSKVAKTDQQHKYKLVLPSLASLQGAKGTSGAVHLLAEKAYKFLLGDNRTIETDNIQDVYRTLNEDFSAIQKTPQKVHYHVSAQLNVAEDDPLGLVLLDTPGPITGFVDWVNALTTLDGSSKPLVILPLSCKKPEMRDGAYNALRDAKKEGKLRNLQIIVVFTFIDEPYVAQNKTLEEALMEVIRDIKEAFGETVIHFALVQCMKKGLAQTDFYAHRQAERETLEKLPESIKNHPGMIKGVAQLEEVLVRLYLKRWDVSGLRMLQGIVERDLCTKKDALAKMTRTISSDSIVLRLAERVTLTDQQAGYTDGIYGREILRHMYDALKDLEMEPAGNTSFMNAIFGSTAVQLEFQNEKKMREAIQTVLQKLQDCIPEALNEMFRQYETYVSHQTSRYGNSCQQLHDRVLALLKEFAIGTTEQPGVITKVIEEAQKWFGRAQSGTKLRGDTKANYKLQLPEKWSANKGSLAQRMLDELGFTMGQLHWNVCMIFFCEICDAFPSWLNGRLTRAGETWSLASQGEIDRTQEELNSLAKTKATLDEIMRLLQ